MVIELSNYQTKKGAFALVLIDIQTSTALKLFKSYDHPDLNGTGKEQIGRQKENAYRQKVYELESDAYEIAQNSDNISKFIPTYFGSVEVESVFQDGKDVSNQYLLGCCFRMAYIEGDDYKLNSIRGNQSALEELKEKFNLDINNLIGQFKSEGIHYIIDSSAIVNDNDFKIIDFATEDPFKFQPIIGA